MLVYQRPRVAILSTGDELADLDERFSEEKIINSNSYGIAAAVQEAGGVPILLGIARTRHGVERKDFARIECRYSRALRRRVDGDYDFTKAVFRDLGAEMNSGSWRSAQVSRLPSERDSGKLAFGLPGNPVSSMVTFEQLVRPAMLKLARARGYGRPLLEAVFPGEVFEANRSPSFSPRGMWREDGVFKVRTTGDQGSGILTSTVVPIV